MPLKFIYGRAGSGKTARCFSLVSSLFTKDDHSNIIYLVPEQFSLEAEKRIITKFGGGCVSRVDVLSFARLANQTFSKYGPLYKESLTPASRQMLIKRTVLAVLDQLSTLQKAASRDDFPETILTTISEFKRHNVTPEALFSFSNETPDQNLALKTHDLALLYEKYLSQIEDPYGDAHDSLNILAEKISQLNLFRDTHFIIDQFNDFTPQEMHVLRQILPRAASVTVSLTTDSLTPNFDSLDIFATPKKTALQLIETALDSGVEILPNELLSQNLRHQNNHELLHLESQIFAYPPESYNKKTDNISIFSANNPAGESEYAALQTMRLVREKGLRFRDITILARNLGEYSLHLKNYFSRYEIPLFIDEKTDSLQGPFIQMALSALDTIIRKFTFDAIFRYIKFEYCGISEGDIHLLENYALAAGILPGQWLSDSPFTFLPRGFSNEQLERINQAKSAVLGPLRILYEKAKGEKTVSQIALAFWGFMEEIDARGTLEARMRGHSREEVRSAEQLWSALGETLSQMDEFLGGEILPLEKFRSILASGLAQREIAQIPPTVDQVQFCAIDRFKSQSPKAIIVLGTLEGRLPRSFTHEGILSDHDRKALESAGITLSQDTLTRQLGERNLIYSLVTAPTEYLFFSHPVADKDGHALPPSPLLTRLRRVFPNITHDNNLYENPNNHDEIEGAQATFHKVTEKLTDIKNGTPLPPVWQTAMTWYEKKWPNQLKKAKKSIEYTGTPNPLSPSNVTTLYGKTLRASVSRAEQFSRCQFAYFLQYGLSAYPRREYQITAPDSGTFMHEIIARFCDFAQELEHGWNSLTPDICIAKVHEITDAVLKESLGEVHLGSPRFNSLSLKLKRSVSTTVQNITQFYQQSGFTPFGREIGFGDNEAFPAIEIPLADGKNARFSGKIDRVDILHTEGRDFISVIDYKSSHKTFDYPQIMGGIQIQLPIYLNAICEILRQKGYRAEPAAMLYSEIGSPVVKLPPGVDDVKIWREIQKELKMQGLVLMEDPVTDSFKGGFAVKPNATAEHFSAISRFALEKLARTMERIHTGAIAINPFRQGKKTACDYCEYRAICQFDPSGNSKYRHLRTTKKEEFFDYVGKMD